MSRPQLLMLAAGCLWFTACSKSDDRKKDEPKEMEVPELNRQTTPSSERSQSTIERIAPKLVAELDAMGLEFGAPVFIRIFKEEGLLELWVKGPRHYKLFRGYKIAAMSGELGPKLEEGDRQAPEGFYFVTPGQMNPNSQFHLSFDLGYPNAYDQAHARTGSALMVHGSCVSIGCFAMTDDKVEEIYTLADAALRNGQPFFRVHSFPFRMTEANMQRHADSAWLEFWQDLKVGYDWFEQHGHPPDVEVRDKRYVVVPVEGL